MRNDFASGGQFTLLVSTFGGRKVIEAHWYSPDEVARFTAQAWAEGAREAVNHGAAASLCVEGLIPREYTNIH